MDEEIIPTATGLGYVDLVEGTGPRPKTGDAVSVATRTADGRRSERTRASNSG